MCSFVSICLWQKEFIFPDPVRCFDFIAIGTILSFLVLSVGLVQESCVFNINLLALNFRELPKWNSQENLFPGIINVIKKGFFSQLNLILSCSRILLALHINKFCAPFPSIYVYFWMCNEFFTVLISIKFPFQQVPNCRSLKLSFLGKVILGIMNVNDFVILSGSKAGTSMRLKTK